MKFKNFIGISVKFRVGMILEKIILKKIILFRFFSWWFGHQNFNLLQKRFKINDLGAFLLLIIRKKIEKNDFLQNDFF